MPDTHEALGQHVQQEAPQKLDATEGHRARRVAALAVAIAEGDVIAVFCQWTGTHDGDGLGFIATGNQFCFENVAVYEFKDGKIINGAVRVLQNLLNTYQQIGVLPPTEEIIKAYNESKK